MFSRKIPPALTREEAKQAGIQTSERHRATAATVLSMEDIKKRMRHVVRTTNRSSARLKLIRRMHGLKGGERTLREASKEDNLTVLIDFRRMVDQLQSLEVALTRTLGVRDLIKTSKLHRPKQPVVSRWRQATMPERPDSPISEDEVETEPKRHTRRAAFRGRQVATLK